MYAITGATGHVGGATADQLLDAGAQVRVVVRDEAKGRAWRGRGAEVAVADYADRDALAAAFAGCRGVFAMLPTVPSATDADADHRRLADNLADAVARSGTGQVVALSSLGAHLAAGTGPIRWLHHLENRLRGTGAVVTALRSAHFQEKVEALLGAVLGAGIYPVFGDSADEPTAMVATRDVGALAARTLLSPPPASEIVDLDGPHYTERDVAERLGAVLGTTLQVVTVPRPGWVAALTDAGVPASLAGELAELSDAEQRGLLEPRGDRTHHCPTGIDDTLRRIDRLAPGAAHP